MIQCYINGQCLTVNQPIIAADTVDYLTFEIIFRSRDWDNLLVTAKFTQGTTTYEAPVVNGAIERNAHVNLTEGEWLLSFVGLESSASGQVVTRITTEQKILRVDSSGVVGGDPFPYYAGGVGEQLVSQANAAKNAALSAQYEAETSEQLARLYSQDALKYSNRIANMTVDAHPLPVGSLPTVTKTGGVGDTPYNLDFGIPEAEFSGPVTNDVLKGDGYGGIEPAIPDQDYISLKHSEDDNSIDIRKEEIDILSKVSINGGGGTFTVDTSGVRVNGGRVITDTDVTLDHLVKKYNDENTMIETAYDSYTNTIEIDTDQITIDSSLDDPIEGGTESKITITPESIDIQSDYVSISDSLSITGSDYQHRIDISTGGEDVRIDTGGDDQDGEVYVNEKRVATEEDIEKQNYVVEKIRDYLYSMKCDYLDYEHGIDYVLSHYGPSSFAGCSVVRSTDLVGRNYDWTYDNKAEFVVKTSGTEGRFASISVCGGLMNDSAVYRDTDLYKIVPFIAQDGVNEKGVFCEINILPELDRMSHTTGTNPGKETVPMLSLVRKVIDYAESADDAIYKIQNDWNIVAPNSSRLDSEMHFMIGDVDKTYVVEFVNNEAVIIDSFYGDTAYRKKPIMTNFYLTGFDGTRESLTPFAMGIERFWKLYNSYDVYCTVDELAAKMQSVNYTRSYSTTENPIWYSEFAGVYEEYGRLDKDSPPEDYAGILEYVRGLYASRSRNTALTWQTVHTSIYNVREHSLNLYVQEENVKYKFVCDISGNDTHYNDLTYVKQYDNVITLTTPGTSFRMDDDGFDYNEQIYLEDERLNIEDVSLNVDVSGEDIDISARNLTYDVNDIAVNGKNVNYNVTDFNVTSKADMNFNLMDSQGVYRSVYVNGSALASQNYVNNYHDNSKQDKLISGANIKTINDQSILGTGNINIQGGGNVSINGVTLQGNKTSMELNIEDYVLYEVSDDSESEYYDITVEQQRRIVKNPYSVLLRMHAEGETDGCIFHFDRKQDTEDDESYYFFVTDPFNGSSCYETNMVIRNTIEESTNVDDAEETFIDIGNSVIEYRVEESGDITYEFVHQCPPRMVLSDIDTGRTFHYWYSDVDDEEDEWEKHYYISEKYISGNTVYYDEVKLERYYEDDFPRFSVDITTGIEFVTLPTIPITSNLLKGNGNGGTVAAVPGTDYLTPSARITETLNEYDSVTLSDNAEYILNGAECYSVYFEYPTGNFECYIRLTTKSNGTTIVFPAGTQYIGSDPQFGNSETWEISVKDGIVVACKVVIVNDE